MFRSGMIVKDITGKILEIESVINAGEGFYSVSGVQLKNDLTPDRRKWSQRASVIHSNEYPLEVIDHV